MKKNIEWIVFDLGGVVVKLNIDGALRELARQSNTDAQIIREHLSTPDESGLSINAKMELGMLTPDEYVNAISQPLNQKLSREEIIELKMQIIQGEDEETIELIRALSRQKKIACFSNTHELHWNHMTRHYQAFQFFEKKIASHLIRAAKPEQKAFARACREIGADPQKCLFIDDVLINAEAAREFGWHSIHFKNHNSLREELLQFGINF